VGGAGLNLAKVKVKEIKKRNSRRSGSRFFIEFFKRFFCDFKINKKTLDHKRSKGVSLG